MNFTREPIIETVITPRDGCKLVLRNSKGGDEEFLVEAVEVVSFGKSFFFRSIESPKAFLVPVTDYEVLELKETRLQLKNVPTDRQIKIGGGRDAQLRPQQQPREPHHNNNNGNTSSEQLSDRKRDRRRRGRRGRDRQHDLPSQPLPPHPEPRDLSHETPHELPEDTLPPPDELPPSEEPPKTPSFISKLFPPPPTLIKETLSRYKPLDEPPFPENIPDKNEKDEDIHFEDR